MKKVLKFGGTSVGSAGNMKKVASIVADQKAKVTVLSAMSGTTDALVAINGALADGSDIPDEKLSELEDKYRRCADSLLADSSKAHALIDSTFAFIRETAAGYSGEKSAKAIVAQGEKMTSAIFSMYLKECGYKTALIDITEAMRTDGSGAVDTAFLAARLAETVSQADYDTLFVTQGFICRDSDGDISNLGRGGSDYSAALIGAAIGADEVQIWTDIDGMHNNDPRYVEGTYPIRHMSFNEAAELAYFGAKILHPSTIQPCREHDIAVKLKNTLDPAAEGTTITASGDSSKKYHAVAAKDDITVVRICSARMLLAYGFLRRVFEIFEKYRTPIDMITTSEVAVSLTIDDNTHVEAIVEELSELGNASYERGNSIICVVGKIEHETPGLVADILDSIRDKPVKMVSYGASSRSVAILINSGDKISALRKLNDHLFANV
ncbi:MAG: aspartate kinase [Rikenellaceae bacterium]|nr:aspartate kinase [Rikenellaceae bacterium]